MARTIAKRLSSTRRYLLFLLLVLVISGIFFFIYIAAEKSLSPRDENAKIKIQHFETPSALLLKINEAAASERNRSLVIAKDRKPGLFSKLSVRTNSNTSKDFQGRGAMPNNKTLGIHSLRLQSAVNDEGVNYNVHIFYYPWYGNVETDGKYLHWNHRMLPHWKKETAAKYPQDVHVPPDDIGSNFYPKLGPYSSADPAVVNTHMAQIRSTGTGVVVMSWYPPGQGDENGLPFDKLVPLVLDAAQSHGLKVCIHIEPYKDRNAETLNQHIRYIIDSYGQHPAFYRTRVGGKELPVFYVYDSYQIRSSVWAHALKPGGPLSLRGTAYDGIFLGLYLSHESEPDLVTAGFDGFYTYFAADGFTKGSTRSNWKRIAEFATRQGLIVVPSIGPGYVDTRIRPWNGENTRERLHGKYFRESFQAALDAGVKYISVTSFNEWHEGSQVEPAVPKKIEGFTYLDYSPHEPEFYLRLLKSFVDKFSDKQRNE